jgi:hypothetical protein
MAGLIQRKDGSAFMRPFALAATAFLIALDSLYLITRGQLSSPDRWSDVYMVILAVYAGAPEVKRWMSGQEPEDPEAWPEKIRKGGPLVTLWILLLFGAGLWRISDPTRPMPPELKETTLKVIGIFFGAYALRQYRMRTGRRTSASVSDSEPAEDPETQKILASLRVHGPQTPKTLSENLAIPRRTVARLLKGLTEEKRLEREGGPFDPSATYRIP